METRKPTEPAIDPAEWIECNARQHPHRLFLSTPGGGVLSYEALGNDSARVAGALRRRGVVPGERVAACLEKSVHAVLLYIACLRMGAVYVPINVGAPPQELDYLLRDSSPRIAVVPAGEAFAHASLAQRAGVQHVETLGADGEGSLSELARACEPEAPAPQAHRPQATAALVYTSGTTGRAKGAMLTRGNLASNAAALAAAWRFTGADVLLHALPLHHVHGLFTAINTVLASASSIQLLPKFDARSVLGQLARATVFMGVPTHYVRLLKERGLTRAATAHVRLFVSGSAPLAAATQQQFLRRTGHEILERYGMTETLMNTSNPYDGPRLPGSVGKALPGIALRVADADSGAVQADAAAIGTLEVRGPNVFAGYWRDPDKTRSAFTADGWFRTGDLGRIDGDGYVHIVGRTSDVIISGGYNVYPREVESQLEELPGVLECAVFGVPHADLGEAVTAALVPQAGAALSEAALLEALHSRLARYKIPRRILLVGELPRNAMGKVQKRALCSSYAALYSEEDGHVR